MGERKRESERERERGRTVTLAATALTVAHVVPAILRPAREETHTHTERETGTEAERARVSVTFRFDPTNLQTVSCAKPGSAKDQICLSLSVSP